MKYIERQQAAKISRKEEVEEQITQAAQFISQLKDLTNLREGQTARFECKYQPANDSSLKVVWLFNGKPIQASNVIRLQFFFYRRLYVITLSAAVIGSRVTTQFEFGVAILVIHRVVQEDSGTYTCLAVNKLGQNQIQANLQVVGEFTPRVQW